MVVGGILSYSMVFCRYILSSYWYSVIVGGILETIEVKLHVRKLALKISIIKLFLSDNSLNYLEFHKLICMGVSKKIIRF